MSSKLHAFQFAKALFLADRHGRTRFVSRQNHDNLLYREEEREMMRLCAEEGIGVIPWSPQARGRLTRDFDEQTFCSQTDAFGKRLHRTLGDAGRTLGDAGRAVAQAVADVAAARGVPRAQVALSWVAHESPVTAPIIGASKASHLDDAVAALSLKLSEDEVAQLEAHDIPHAAAGLRE